MTNIRYFRGKMSRTFIGFVLNLMLLGGAGLCQGEAIPPLFRIGQGKVVGFVDTNAQVVVQPKYEGCGRWAEGFVWTVGILGQRSGNFMDGEGKELLDEPWGEFYDSLGWLAPQFENGRAIVAYEDAQYHFIVATVTDKGKTFAGTQQKDGEYILTVKDGLWGAVDEEGRQLIPCRFEALQSFSDGYAPAMANQKWGIIDSRGEWVMEPTHSKLGMIENGVAYIQENMKWGFIRVDGQLVYKPVFDNFRHKDHGVITVLRGDHWGLLDVKKRKMLAPAIYDEIGWRDEHSAAIRKGDKWGVVGFDGSVVLPFEYDEVRLVSGVGDYWVVGKNGMKGLVNTKGEWLLPCEHWEIDSCNAEYCTFSLRSPGSVGLVHLPSRRIVISPKYDRIFPPDVLNKTAIVIQSNRFGLEKLGEDGLVFPVKYNGMAYWHELVRVNDGPQVALFDLDGKEVLPWSAGATQIPGEDDTLVNGVGKIVCQGKAGLINEEGKIVLACQYEDVGEFSDGLAAVQHEGKWGIVKLDGEWMIAAEYEAAHAFVNGYAAVRQNGKWGLVDKDGKSCIPFQYADMGYVYNGRVPAAEESDGTIRWGLLDLSGKTALPLEYDCVEWIDLDSKTTRLYGAVAWREY